MAAMTTEDICAGMSEQIYSYHSKMKGINLLNLSDQHNPAMDQSVSICLATIEPVFSSGNATSREVYQCFFVRSIDYRHHQERCSVQACELVIFL